MPPKSANRRSTPTLTLPACILWYVGIEHRPLTAQLVLQLFELANTPFNMRAFRERWAKYGWTHEAASSDSFGFHVEIPDQWPLNVDPLGPEIICARVPVCYWTEDDVDSGYEPGKVDQQRKAFDEAFVAAESVVRRQLSNPFMTWTDATEPFRQARMWAGLHGVLTLQQACFDPQFGLEINVWLQEGTRAKFQPTSPLIDWLCDRSRSRHEEKGFPPLP